ncbi:MAG TPA: hypothetical protein VG435_18395 [Acidimicrobiales bacterium]|jgi:hypothetical protein|nr:hypothetical protein [Acidimicrobiales bacterium]
MTGPSAVRARAARGLVLLLVTGVVILAAVALGGFAKPAYSQVNEPCHSLLCPPDSSPSSVPSSDTTAPTDTTTTSVPVSTTTVAHPTVYTASFLPCGDTTGGQSTEVCVDDPSQIQLLYPASARPAAIQVDWVTGSRSAKAPDPASTSVTLMFSDGSNCGTQAQCWPWPSAMTDRAFTLNGSYQVVTCLSYRNNTCGTAQTTDIGVAAPPGAPQSVAVQATGSEVTLGWRPPGQTPPDLAGYTVNRNGKRIYICSIGGLEPGVSTSCPPSLTVADHPGNGQFDYTVSALRLGANGNDLVASSPTDAGGPVTVPGSGQTVGDSSGGQTVGSSPIIGSVGTVSGSSSDPGQSVSITPAPGTATVQTLPGPTGVDPAVAAAPQNLKYPTSNPVTGKSASALSLKVNPASNQTDLVPAGVLAMGLIVLAIAAHFLYLRVELSVLDSRLGRLRRSEP